MQRSIPCMIFRGGTSKGLFFRAADLPAGERLRNAIVARALGSPDSRQIDGLGGAHPLTSKVAVVDRSESPEADIDYLFLQVDVDTGAVSDRQNCGNLLAAVGPFAAECGLIATAGPVTEVRVRMLNSGGRAIARLRTPDGVVA
ncbi:MAG: PrpF domain-containing protein, partial [Pseudomonadota bacterium]